MRKRNDQLNIRLTETEANALTRYAAKCGLTKSGYIRMMLSGYVPKETPPKEYGELLCVMTELYAGLKEQSADALAGKLQDAILRLQAEVTLPERRL